jgi:hypothetical protein
VASIIDFLEARIGEDEVRATMREWHTIDCETIPNDAGYSYPCDCGVPERMAAECAAKRAIIESLTNTTAAHAKEAHLGQKLVLAGMDTGLRVALQALTVPYREHPDFDEDWQAYRG